MKARAREHADAAVCFLILAASLLATFLLPPIAMAAIAG